MKVTWIHERRRDHSVLRNEVGPWFQATLQSYLTHRLGLHYPTQLGHCSWPMCHCSWPMCRFSVTND